MKEEMIRGKEAFGGCLFTGCACLLIGTLLLVVFVFRDFIFFKLFRLNMIRISLNYNSKVNEKFWQRTWPNHHYPVILFN